MNGSFHQRNFIGNAWLERTSVGFLDDKKNSTCAEIHELRKLVNLMNDLTVI